MNSYSTKRKSITHYAWLSIAAAILTIALKLLAYLLTDSVGLLSDALESLINLAGAIMALAMLSIAIRPADADHAFGHTKAEYFSSGVEGILILVAAIFIGIASINRFFNPKPLDKVSIGLAVSVLASLINLGASVSLKRAGKRYRSITLEADAKHLMTDVWTSAGVIVGVALVALTGWLQLDAIVAFLVACNIVWTGFTIIQKSVSGLMDKVLTKEDLKIIDNILEPYRETGIQFHAILTRQAGARQFVSFHVLVPGAWTVMQGHQLLEQIEADLRNALPDIVVSTHLEPLEDPTSYDDISFDRI